MRAFARDVFQKVADAHFAEVISGFAGSGLCRVRKHDRIYVGPPFTFQKLRAGGETRLRVKQEWVCSRCAEFGQEQTAVFAEDLKNWKKEHGETAVV